MVHERLILEHDVGDMYSGSYTVAHPVSYKSAEDFIVDFEEAVYAARKVGSHFTMAGIDFDSNDYFQHSPEGVDTYFPPNIMTVDEWFINAGQ